MITIKPQSSIPGVSDDCLIYSGSKAISNGSNRILIQTELRHYSICYIEADITNQGHPDPLVHQSQKLRLGEEVGVNANGELNFLVSAPATCTVRWFIVGFTSISIPNTHHQEITSEDQSNLYASTIRQLKSIISNAGTTASEKLNNTGATFTYSHPSSGVYRLTSDINIFSTDKHIFFAQIQGESGVNYAGTFDVTVALISATVIEVICRLDGSVNDLPTGLKIYLSVDIFPSNI